MKSQFFNIFLAVSVCLTFELWNVHADEGFKASGHLEVTAYKTDGMPFSSHHSDFEIEVNGNEWEMTSTQGTGHTIRVGSDGKAVYSLMSFPSSMPLDTNTAPPAIIDSGSYYLSGTPYENVVWYALASSGLTNDVFPAPWLNARNDPTAAAFVAKTDKRLNAGLPEKVEFFVSTSQVKKAATNDNVLVEIPSPITEHFTITLDIWKNNFLAAHYEVLDSTNIGAITIPLHFRLERFTPDYPKDMVFEAFDGIISSLSYSQKTNFVPGDFGIVGVTDLRFKNVKDKVDGIRYQTSNEWLSKDNTNLLGIYKQKLERKPQTLQHSFDDKNKRTLPALITMAIVFISPVFFLIKRYRKK